MPAPHIATLMLKDVAGMSGDCSSSTRDTSEKQKGRSVVCKQKGFDQLPFSITKLISQKRKDTGSSPVLSVKGGWCKLD